MDKSVINKIGFFAVPKQHNVKLNDANAPVDYQVYAIIFTNTYNYAMDLIERMSSYIDGPGKILPRTLDANLIDLYASEAMSTSTRLMQIAAWLLLLRSAIEGDMSYEDSIIEKNKLCLNTASQKNNHKEWHRLPIGLCSLVEESLSLESRIRTLDIQLTQASETVNSVHQHQTKLQKVFNF